MRIRRVFIYPVVIAALWAALVLWAQRSILYPRNLANGRPNANLPRPDVEQIWLDTPQGPVEGWLLLGQGVSPTEPGPAVLFAHGNAELIDDWPQLMNAYHAAGITILMGEYRGYGRSAGKPSERAINEDFVRFYDHLASRPQVDGTRIIFHGRSLGGGVLCGLANRRPPAAMIIQSTFVSVTAIASKMFVPRFLILDPYNNLKAIGRLKCPILIIHGRHDQIIPHHHAEAIHAAALHSQMITYECGHNDCPPDWNLFWHDVVRFLRDQHIIMAP